jgi:TolA-binding protein
MWRFLLPALAMMAALVVLFAGALGDLQSLPEMSDRAIAIVGGLSPRQASPPSAPAVAPPAAAPAVQPATRDAVRSQQASPPSAPAVAPPVATPAEQPAARDAERRQVADLQGQNNQLQEQIAQRTHDLDAARAEIDKLRQTIDTLHQQRRTEQATLARQKPQEQQSTAAAPTQSPAPRPFNTPGQPVPSPPASQQLLTARQWLAAGRPDEARHLLTMAQTQMVLQPVTPDQPAAQGGNPSATDIGNAIRWLDIGANGQAMQAIDRAIDNAGGGGTRARPWPGYPVGAPTGYYQPSMPGYDVNDGIR